MDLLALVGGVIFILGGFIKKKFDIYYERNILPTKTESEQRKYHDCQQELSEKGAYNIPFKDGKLISSNNTIHDFNNAIIFVGIMLVIIGLISSII